MPNPQRRRKWLGVLLAAAVTALTATSALAVPPSSVGLALANDYGTVTWEQVAPTPAEVAAGIKDCYRFRVENTQQPLSNPASYKPLRSLPPSGPVQGFGIKGLVVYHPVAPVMMSDPSRTSTTLFQSKNEYSWWDHNGSEDADGNGLQDRFTEPLETNTGSNSGYTDRENLYRLCYNQKIDPSKFILALHVVEPFSGNTFFALGDQRPSLSLVKKADCTSIAKGSVVSYTLTVKNTGTLLVTNIKVTDTPVPGSPAVVGVVDSLAPGASTELKWTAAPLVTTTDTATAEGTAGNLPVTTTSNPVTVEVHNPALHVALVATPKTSYAGDPVKFTATVTNTGDVMLSGVALNFGDGVIQNIGTLGVGDSQDFERTIVLPANQTAAYTLTVEAQGSASFCEKPVTATASAQGQVQISPRAALGGVVFCIGEEEETISGATVRLLRPDTSTVEVVTTDTQGKFTFSQPIQDGLYAITVTAPDYEVFTSLPFNYAHDGLDKFVPAGLTPLPISYRAAPIIHGKVFFSFSASNNYNFPALTEANLYQNFVSPTAGTFPYTYVGRIPGFPELGHFGGPGEPKIRLDMVQPLLPENQWHNCSFTNQVGIFGVINGTGKAGDYTYRMLFNQPFDGPGTAHNYELTQVYLAGPQPTTTPVIFPVSLVRLDGSALPLPPPGDVPAGWMAQAWFQFTLPPAVSANVHIVGGYRNACGEAPLNGAPFGNPFDICPPSEAGAVLE